MAKNHVVVVGAGIVGVSTAIWLQRSGFTVTLLDREGLAAGTSYGNAGVLAAAAVVPVTVPGLLKKAPGMLFSPDQPLFLRWSYLPKLLPFLVRYLATANHEDLDRISAGLAGLMHDTAQQHVSLAKGTKAGRYITTGDYLFGYESKKEYEKDGLSWATRARHGIEFEEMTGDRLAEYDPSLAGRFGFAVRCPEHGHISDPGAYLVALADHFTGQGGKLHIGEAMDIPVENGKAIGVLLEDGLLSADHVVIATGVWSGPLARKMGVKIPMESERGYHVEFVNPNISFKSPVMVNSGKFVMNSMAGRLRCAGIVEFGGLNAPASKAPTELLKRQTRELIPELEYESTNEWMGHRPSTPDSLPLIGAFADVPNVWAGFGHQHLGLTGGPKTGRLIAQLIKGEKPNIDLSAYSPQRFT